MVGNAGDDIFVVDNVGDTVSDLASGGGTDQVNSSVSFALVANIENLSLLGSDNINAIGNSGMPALAPAAGALLGDPDPTVAEAARWALARLRR